MREKIMEKFYQSEKFLILTHVRPDGDAVSSAVAIYHFLVSLGKEHKNIEVFIPNISNDLSFIDNKNVITRNCKMNDYDLVIVVDCSDYSRVEGSSLLEGFSAKQRIIIDHHEISEDLLIEAENSIIDISASSCTCIIYREFYMYMCKQKNSDFLKCIATGILSDTIGLTINVSDECKKILNYCKKMGIDNQNIKEKLNNVDIRTQTLTNLAIKRLVVHKKIGCTYILQSDLEQEERDLKKLNHKAIIQKIFETAPCKTLILLIENENQEFKGSMRTTVENLDLNSICTLMVKKNIFLQGGGHSYSAGFKIAISDSTMETAKYVFKILTTYILDLHM